MLLLLGVLLLAPTAGAHADGFAAIGIAVNPGDPAEVWAVVDGWGLVRTEDGGQGWSWICEESLGTPAYDIAATGPGEAWVAVLDGILRIEEGCSPSAVAGWPEGTWPFRVVPSGSGIVAAGTGGGQDGLWRCTLGGCSPSLVDPTLLPRSLQADGDRLWATFLHETTLHASLRSSEDGIDWTTIYEWTDGDSDPRVLFAHGEVVIAWSRPFAEAAVPKLLLSEDGGQSFDVVLEAGAHTDPVPGFVALPEGGYLLSSWAAPRAYASADGRSWEEVEGLPSFRCGATTRERSWVCTPRAESGWDLATTVDGRVFEPAACLETSISASCADETCAVLEAALHSAATAVGEPRCEEGSTAEDSASADTPARSEAGCGGCGGGGAAVLLPGLLLARPRRRKGISCTR